MAILKIKNLDKFMSPWGSQIDWEKAYYNIDVRHISKLTIEEIEDDFHGIYYVIELTPYYNFYNNSKIFIDADFYIKNIFYGGKAVRTMRLDPPVYDCLAILNFLEFDTEDFPIELSREELNCMIEERKLMINSLSNSKLLLSKLRLNKLEDLTATDDNEFKLFIDFHQTDEGEFEYFDFKISNGSKEYVIKHLVRFLNALNAEDNFQFGKNNTWKLVYDKFDAESKKILNFINNNATYYDWRQHCFLKYDLADDLYNMVSSLQEEYHNGNFYEIDRKVNITIKHERHSYLLNYSIDECDLKYLYSGKNNLYLLKGSGLVKLNFDKYGVVANLLQEFSTNFNNEKFMAISEEVMPSFYQEILLANNKYINLSGDIDFLDNIVFAKNIRIYSDLEDSIIKVWGNYSIDSKRYDLFDEKHRVYPIDIIEDIIAKYASDINDNYAYFKTKGSNLFAFLDQGIVAIQELAEVYISEELINLKLRKNLSFRMDVRTNNDLLKINFDTNVSKEELFALLNAYRKKKNYYQLKDGQIISLVGEELKRFDEVVEKMNLNKKDLLEDEIERPIYEAIHFNEYQEEMDVRSSKNVQTYLNKLNKLQDYKDITISNKYTKLLRSYQVDGVKWLKSLMDLGLNGILADDMGLGKTIQVLAFLDEFTDHSETSIIICPSSLMYNWYSEITKFNIDIDAVCVSGNSEERKALAKEKHQLYITTYDYLKRDFDLYKKKEFNYVILDEAHYIKNATTQNAKSVKQLKAKHRLALTGTPIENSLSELWSIFDFLLPGYLFDHKYFLKTYEQEIQSRHNERRQEELKKLVQPFILRRTKKAVLNDLPDKLEKDLWIEMNEDEEKLYLANLMQVNTELQRQLEADKVDSILVLAMMTKLRQLCCEPRLVYDNINTLSSKLNACLELIEVLMQSNKKILLFSNFTTIFDLMIDEFEKRKIKYHLLTGKTSKEKRQEEVDAFQNDDSNVFLISLKAGGTGLNLTKAEAVIHFDPWWNLSAQNQATDRAYRIGQTKDVIVYKLLMKNTIEEKIHELQLSKKEISDIFIENSNISISKMSASELVELFKIKLH